ncbi:MAG: hypothetical protein J2P37_32210 [Ktedonobacteraceae bacterium]|nr:hypothetical protein [Ktedonobacteraceae bacterium]
MGTIPTILLTTTERWTVCQHPGFLARKKPFDGDDVLALRTHAIVPLSSSAPSSVPPQESLLPPSDLSRLRGKPERERSRADTVHHWF